MARVIVVGAGASGVHFALTALERGHRVTMLDVGNQGSSPPLPDTPFDDLKRELEDPIEYLLGSRFDGVVMPESEGEYYGIPPSKGYVFEAPDRSKGFSASGFQPLFSFASGGLAQAWTGGCYPFNDHDLADFPLSYRDLEPHYEKVARRIGINGADDDLAAFLPYHGDLQEPLELDFHSELLLERYESRRERLNRLGFFMGRTRVATLTTDAGERRACDYLGRCLWGCPRDSLYTPAHTLRKCMRSPDFEYRRGCFVTHFTASSGGRVRSVVWSDAEGMDREMDVDILVLAAGTLCTSRIVLRSIQIESGGTPALSGLMDNRQVLVPFVNLGMLGRRYPERSYQYHMIGIGLEGPRHRDYVHGQVTTLTTAMMHPIIQRLPFDLRTSTRIARASHAALGVVNLNFHDTRRSTNRVSLTATADGGEPSLALEYTPPEGEHERIAGAIKTLRKALLRLGCIVPPGMTHVRPMGSSVHYAGTLPMTVEPGSWTTTPEGRSRDFGNLILADGTTFPFLPSKNITFTLMANATRLAAAL